jgi:hypothetical protein
MIDAHDDDYERCCDNQQARSAVRIIPFSHELALKAGLFPLVVSLYFLANLFDLISAFFNRLIDTLAGAL